MKKVLIAVDDKKGSKAVLSTFCNLVNPAEEVIPLKCPEVGREVPYG